jgi:hypothetical protein
MHTRGQVARKLAKVAGFRVTPVTHGGLRVTSGFVLELGPEATADEVATAACRRILALEQVHDELEVVELVHGYGFNYAGMGARVPRMAS